MLYYDRQTETFWSQMTGEAVVGPLTGKRLAWIPTTVTTWAEWRKDHPETTVLRPPHSPQLYFRRNAYARYRRTQRTMFPTGPHEIDPSYQNKDLCTIVLRDGKARCYPHPALEEGENRDGDLVIRKKGDTVVVVDDAGNEVPSLQAYWFAWCAFYPEGTVWKPAG